MLKLDSHMDINDKDIREFLKINLEDEEIFKDLQYPVTLNQIKKFEKKSKICINIIKYSSNGKNGNLANKFKPHYISEYQDQFKN